jgi:hypothetical protein
MSGPLSGTPAGTTPKYTHVTAEVVPAGQRRNKKSESTESKFHSERN